MLKISIKKPANFQKTATPTAKKSNGFIAIEVAAVYRAYNHAVLSRAKSNRFAQRSAQPIPQNVYAVNFFQYPL